MKFKKLMLVAFVLLAVITIGAVSAADNASSVGDFSSGDVLAVDESSEDLAENPSDEIIVSDDDLSSDADEILASSESLSENVTVEVRDKVDASEDNGYIAYVRDDNSLNGTVTLSIDGTQYYNKEFDATKSSVFIRDSDLKDFNFGDFLGNHTVKLTYNNLSKESVVLFVFEPYFIQPYTVAAGEVSYIIFKAPGDFKGEAALYDAVYNNVTDNYDPDKLLVRYLISASASEIPLPKLSAGGHVFYVNYTIDGKNNTELFGVYYVENSQNFTSDISSDEINVGDSVTVTVTGPKEGWIDLYVNGKHKALYSLANNTTVKHVFSDLGVGTHVISISYDNQGYNDLFYQKEFLVTVSDPSASPGIVDNSIDSSTTSIHGELILSDIATGEVFKSNITVVPIKSSLSKFNNTDVDGNITEVINQLLNLAQIQAGGKTVTVKSQNVTNSVLERYDNRTYNWIDSGGYLEIGGDYGTSWLVNVTVVAEYASGSSCMVSFNATGGEGEMVNVVVENNTNFTLPECGFTKEYRVFYGWNVGDAIKQPGENITIIGDIAIKTVWRSDSEFNNTTGKAEVKDIAVDLSTTSIDGRLLLTDLSTGAVYLINITVGPVKSNYTNPGNDAVIGDMINDTVSQLLNLAQLQTGGKTVTVKNQTVSNVTSTELNDTRIYALHNYYEGADGLIESPRFLFVSGDYGTAWTYPVLVEAEYTGVVVVNIAEVNVKLSKAAFTYNGKVQKPVITLTDGVVLKEGVDYTLKWSAASPKNAGTYSVTVTGIGAYSGTVKVTFKINKAANPLAVKAKTVKVKFSAVKKKAQALAVSKVVTFTKKGQGTLTYAKASGNKKITINKKTGKVTVGKGLKKGTYNVKVKIKAAGNANYKASAYKTLTFKIKIS